MKKFLITLSVLVVILALGTGIYYLSQFLNQPTEEEIQSAQEEIDEQFKTAEANMPEGERLDLQVEFPDDMEESRMITIIHQMSHQKVKASDKWGQYQITQERVNRLLEVAKRNQPAYKHGNVYVDILGKWSEGDFSKADEHHNKVWAILGGNVGQATGLLSPVEEKAYIEKHFKSTSTEEMKKNEQDEGE
ncbi:hypothetical protein D1B33_09670 [Lysinibacillus yapensis]|uniref:CTP synthase n=1 Tax=Ureibacillus yapensis TaxID=2304605 RepID=A0A396S720_9BACL|nr:DUF6241 domain-containing protein [Lysinibacillus yapensis]RHW36661.1 hypothetical protein D1B33_09670 [Lysinibacillus yapensis]